MKIKKKQAIEELDLDSLKAEENEMLQKKKKLNRLMDQEESYIFWDNEN